MAYLAEFARKHASGTIAVLTLWTDLTYVHSSWTAVSYLRIAGNKGAGKTRIIEILRECVFRPTTSSNLTAATLMRTIHSQGGTLLFDEAERLRNTQAPDIAETNSMLLAGYKRGGQAQRMEAFGDNQFRTVHFDVFGPKLIASISGVSPALASRCIEIMMLAVGKTSPIPRRRIDEAPHSWQSIRDRLYCLALSEFPTWSKLAAQKDVCPQMTGRDFELWQPLLAIARWLEPFGLDGLHELLRKHALASIDNSVEDQLSEEDEALLRILLDFWQNGSQPTPSEILKRAIEADQKMFERWKARRVGACLRRHGAENPSINGRRGFQASPDVIERIKTTLEINDDPTPL